MSFPDLFSAPDWQPAVTALLAIMLITLTWTYVRCAAAIWVRVVCAVLKAIGVLLLGICLLEPMQISEVPKPGANLFVLMADASQSLQVRDAGSDISREQLLRQKIVDETGWQNDLEQAFELRKFSFARQVTSTDFSRFNADGIGSSIVTSLESVARRYQGQPVAGILLFTDGNATDNENHSIDWSQLPPVYPVVVGRNDPESDIGISGFSVSQTNFEAAPVNIAAELKTTGYTGKELRAQLVDEAGKVVEEQIIKDDGKRDVAALRFKVRPEEPGVNVYRLRVAEDSKFVVLDDPEASSEATMVNNERTIMVDRARGPYRILYVSGRPNWEFKFLRRAMQADDEIDLVGLIRIAREEPKFTFRSHRDESTNPLFRGFGNERDEDAERYDEPVLVRLGTRNAEELRDGFPKSPEELFQYQAIILDDVESRFFTEDQKSLIHEFVNVRGGGFLMLGGQESFFEGGYDRTPIGELLPVYVDRRVARQDDAAWRLVLTREGWLQPWVRIESTEHEESIRLDRMAQFATVNSVHSVKPGASVLATVENENGDQLNALVAQRMGKGRAAALLIGDLWKWHLRNDFGNDDMLKAWRQMLRWLIADVPQRVEIDIRKMADANLSVQLRVSVVNEAFQPLDNADVVTTITRPDGSEVELKALPMDEDAGLFGATYVPRQPGPYRVEVQARAADGSVIGSSRSGWVSEPANAEFEQLVPNRRFLEQVASNTGGELVELNQLNGLVRKLPSASAPVTETKLNPWWHNSWMFLAAIGFLVSEWGLRRWKGLP